MTKFELLFGIKESEVKKNCILMPLLPKGVLGGFGINKFLKGKLYSSGNSRNFTLVQTGMGAGFVGDAVLYLKDTACENLMLFGSCGLTKKKDNLDFGSVVSPFKCHSNESFSDLLLENIRDDRVFYPDKEIFKSLIKEGQKIGIKEVICLTISSLKLEEDRFDSIEKKGIEVLDMECSAFFSASKYAGLKAAALFYVNDIINSAPFYNLNDKQKSGIDSAIKKEVDFLREFIKSGKIY